MARDFPRRLNALREALERDLGKRASPEPARRACIALFDGAPALPKDDLKALGETPVAHLVALDADHIRRFVFESERPQVTGGASRVLEDVNGRVLEGREAPQGFLGCVYSAGGVGLLLASGEASAAGLEQACREWLEGRAQGLGPGGQGLSFTVAATPVHASDLTGGSEPRLDVEHLRLRRGLPGVLARLQALLRTAKDAKAPRLESSGLPTHAPGRAATRCPSCGRRAPNPEGDLVRADEPPWCRHCMGLRGRYVRAERAGAAIRYDELAARSRSRRRYLAFLSLDGNGLGRYLQELTSLSQLAAFSEAVTGVFEAARTRARETVGLVPSSYGASLEAESDSVSLLSGGDEVVLILPSAAGWQALQAALATVEAEFSALGHDDDMRAAFRNADGRLAELAKAGSSAGLVISPATFPVRLLRRYADTLVKRAKGRLAADARSSACALLLTDASPLPSLNATAGAADESIQVLASLAELDAFVREARAAQDCRVPTSAFQGIRRAELEEDCADPLGRERSLGNFLRYQLVRHEDTLGAWWNEVQRDRGACIEAWFRRPHRVRHLLDALTLEPVWSAPRC